MAFRLNPIAPPHETLGITPQEDVDLPRADVDGELGRGGSSKLLLVLA